MFTCTRCGAAYDGMHTCVHPLHTAIDPECVFADPEADPPERHLLCDICRPIRLLLDEGMSL